jgi:hypothetical protein
MILSMGIRHGIRRGIFRQIPYITFALSFSTVQAHFFPRRFESAQKKIGLFYA